MIERWGGVVFVSFVPYRALGNELFIFCGLTILSAHTALSQALFKLTTYFMYARLQIRLTHFWAYCQTNTFLSIDDGRDW